MGPYMASDLLKIVCTFETVRGEIFPNTLKYHSQNLSHSTWSILVVGTSTLSMRSLRDPFHRLAVNEFISWPKLKQWKLTFEGWIEPWRNNF